MTTDSLKIIELNPQLVSDSHHQHFIDISSIVINSTNFDSSLKYAYSHQQGRHTSHKNLFSFFKDDLQYTLFDNLNKLINFSNQEIYSLHCDASTYNIEDNEHSSYIKPEHNYISYNDLNLNNNSIIQKFSPNSVIAGIIRFENKDITSYQKPIVCNDSNIAELLAIQEGLLLAQSLNIKNLYIYTDSSVSITFIRKHFQSHTKYMKNDKFVPLTSKILDTIVLFDSCHFIHIPRKQNKQADKLTRMKLHLK